MNKDSQNEIIKACTEVHRELRGGFPEEVYQEALAVELGMQKVPFEQDVQFPIYYKGKPLGVFYKASLVCHGEIIVDLRATTALTSKEEAQVKHHLQATKKERALLVNFGGSSLEYRWVVV
ncbi:GxxExxY protein [Pedosphaera parvula]|uniref:GxxExxY protein n=1 Tax=Pedosphaera parvula (strain Ellin514) TaxID=320771 RepID=B9XDP3_PEDPL|nr:GxxExxY protein [Pedosphaera parvula]EEF62189.1 conserved hypothetical protein [Pedosphaera parvula Ellin514]